MQSNRLVVTLNKEMQIGFERGLNQVYENSVLVNEFVVKLSFLLETNQSLLVTFKNAESNATVTLKPMLLAQRKVTANGSEEQSVDNDVAQIPQTVNAGYEYYTLLPIEITQAPGTWYFSLQVCQIPEGAKLSEKDIEEAIKQLQNKTSDIACFDVYSSLSGAGPNGSAPSDYDIMNLYNTATEAVATAEESAIKAQEAAKEVDTITSDIVGNITKRAVQQATEQAIAATEQAVVDEENRATQAESALAQRIDTINAYIPSSTSATNQLANNDFVNSSINNMAAFYITSNAQGDAFGTRASLLNATTYYCGGQVRMPTQNDYAIVLEDDSQPQGVDGKYPTTRYSYQGAKWSFQYVVNNTSFTQAQINAINSGITAEFLATLATKSYVSTAIADAITTTLNTPV